MLTTAQISLPEGQALKKKRVVSGHQSAYQYCKAFMHGRAANALRSELGCGSGSLNTHRQTRVDFNLLSFAGSLAIKQEAIK